MVPVKPYEVPYGSSEAIRSSLWFQPSYQSFYYFLTSYASTGPTTHLTSSELFLYFFGLLLIENVYRLASPFALLQVYISTTIKRTTRGNILRTSKIKWPCG